MNYLDHQMMNELEPFTTINPSAENLAKYFYDETNSRLKTEHQRPGAGEGRHHLGDRHHHRAVLASEDRFECPGLKPRISGKQSDRHG